MSWQGAVRQEGLQQGRSACQFAYAAEVLAAGHLSAEKHATKSAEIRPAAGEALLDMLRCLSNSSGTRDRTDADY
jgi:hypothetical protein